MTAHRSFDQQALNFLLMTFTYILLCYEESLKICKYLHGGTH